MKETQKLTVTLFKRCWLLHFRELGEEWVRLPLSGAATFGQVCEHLRRIFPTVQYRVVWEE